MSGLRIYFSCSLTGGRQDQPVYAELVAHLQAAGHDVLSAHLADPGVLARDGELDPVSVYERDTAWVRACDVVVAEVSTPSHGAGFEIAYAQELGKPVLCLHRSGVRVSKMLTGNRRPGMAVHPYGDAAEAAAILDAALATVAPAT